MDSDTPRPAPDPSIKATPHPAPKAAAPSLEYDRTEFRVTRKQWRLLMAVTLMNSIICVWFAIGPEGTRIIRSQWDLYQARRAQHERDRQAEAQQQACLDYVAPAGQVIYQESQAAALQNLNTFARDPNDPISLMGGEVPAQTARSPVCWQEFLPRAMMTFGVNREWMAPVVYLGGRTPPGGKSGERPAIVTVQITAAQEYLRVGAGRGRACRTASKRILLASAFAPAPAGQAPKLLSEFSVAVVLPESETSLRTDGTWKTESGPVLTLFAGQSDSQDPSHFMLPYKLDDVNGQIDGWLRDGGVVLKPGEGPLQAEQFGNAWRLVAVAPPATGPAATAPTSAKAAAGAAQPVP